MSDLKYPTHLMPWNLEPHYASHVAAMTEENLHSKADIAMQLAWRDQRIEELRARNDVICEGFALCLEELAKIRPDIVAIMQRHLKQ